MQLILEDSVHGYARDIDYHSPNNRNTFICYNSITVNGVEGNYQSPVTYNIVFGLGSATAIG